MTDKQIKLEEFDQYDEATRAVLERVIAAGTPTKSGRRTLTTGKPDKAMVGMHRRR